MNKDLYTVLFKVLDLISYEGDKDVFVKKFVVLCHLKACWQLIWKLSKEDRDLIDEKIYENISPTELRKMISRWYGDKEYDEELRVATNNMFVGCFEKSIEQLSRDDRAQLRVALS